MSACCINTLHKLCFGVCMFVCMCAHACVCLHCHLIHPSSGCSAPTMPSTLPLTVQSDFTFFNLPRIPRTQSAWLRGVTMELGWWGHPPLVLWWLDVSWWGKMGRDKRETVRSRKTINKLLYVFEGVQSHIHTHTPVDTHTHTHTYTQSLNPVQINQAQSSEGRRFMYVTVPQLLFSHYLTLLSSTIYTNSDD